MVRMNANSANRFSGPQTAWKERRLAGQPLSQAVRRNTRSDTVEIRFSAATPPSWVTGSSSDGERGGLPPSQPSSRRRGRVAVVAALAVLLGWGATTGNLPGMGGNGSGQEVAVGGDTTAESTSTTSPDGETDSQTVVSDIQQSEVGKIFHGDKDSYRMLLMDRFQRLALQAPSDVDEVLRDMTADVINQSLNPTDGGPIRSVNYTKLAGLFTLVGGETAWMEGFGSQVANRFDHRTYIAKFDEVFAKHGGNVTETLYELGTTQAQRDALVQPGQEQQAQALKDALMKAYNTHLQETRVAIDAEHQAGWCSVTGGAEIPLRSLAWVTLLSAERLGLNASQLQEYSQGSVLEGIEWPTLISRDRLLRIVWAAYERFADPEDESKMRLLENLYDSELKLPMPVLLAVALTKVVPPEQAAQFNAGMIDETLVLNLLEAFDAEVQKLDERGNRNELGLTGALHKAITRALVDAGLPEPLAVQVAEQYGKVIRSLEDGANPLERLEAEMFALVATTCSESDNASTSSTTTSAAPSPSSSSTTSTSAAAGGSTTTTTPSSAPPVTRGVGGS